MTVSDATVFAYQRLLVEIIENFAAGIVSVVMTTETAVKMIAVENNVIAV